MVIVFFLVLFFFNVAAVVSGTQEKGKLKKLDRFKKILKGCYFSVCFFIVMTNTLVFYMRFQSWSRKRPFGDTERSVKEKAGGPKCPKSRRLELEGLTIGRKHKQEAKFKDSSRI